MIILASKSPRRKELMEKHFPFSFIIIPSDVEEITDIDLSPIENTINIAKAKGEDIFKDHLDDIVISCDTIVTLNNKIFGKPKNKEDALAILEELSNQTHEVISAYWIFSKKKIISNYVVSKVTFNKLNKEDILSYIELGTCYDKAGSYAIQDPVSSKFIKSYSGSLNNIIGFPVEEIKKDLEGLI